MLQYFDETMRSINGFLQESDTKIMKENLSNYNKTEEWLKKELKVRGYKDTSNILLATIDINEKLTVYEKNVKEETNDILE